MRQFSIFNYQVLTKVEKKKSFFDFQFSNSEKGLSFVDVLVGISLMLIVFLAILGAYRAGLRVISQSKTRIVATALANQKIELARSLSYNNVGVVGGIPSGTIPETEIINRNNIDYLVKTTVVYIDDPFDGLSPADLLAADYKRIKVKVSWSHRYSGEVNLITDISPKGIETSLGDGTLFISVFDASGLSIAQADLHVKNDDVNPSIDAWYQSDDSGNLILPGTPTSIESYYISASKSGFSTDRTYSSEEVVNPSKPFASVYEGDLTEIGFTIDQLSSMTVQTRGTMGQGYPPVHNVSFAMTGAKIIGQENGEPVYKYSQSHMTNGPAKIDILNLEWDSYSFSVDKEITGLHLIVIESPLGDTAIPPIDLLPGTTQEVRLILRAENTLLVMVQDVLTLEPIFGAIVNLSNVEFGYDEIQPTDEDGKTFFIPLEEATYQLVVEIDGYISSTDSLFISGETNEIVNLISLP